MTTLTTLAALILALLGAVRLPDPTTRLQGAVLLAAGVVLSVYSFWRVEKEWPRRDPAPEVGPKEPAASSTAGSTGAAFASAGRIIGIVMLVAGLGLAFWALLDIWGKPFVWNQAGRWMLGLLLLLAGLYLVGRSAESGKRKAESQDRSEDFLSSSPPPAGPAPSTPRFYGPRPAGYKLRALGLDEDSPEIGESVLSEAVLSEAKEHTTAVGDVVAEPVSASPAPSLSISLPRWLEIAVVVAILLAAVFFRLYRIESMPPGIFIDETNTALDALRILEGRPDSLFGTGWFETPNGFAYLQLAVIRLLGTTFAAIKVQSIIPGILTVLALWLLARELFGPLPAIFAAAFLAFNRWHFSMSRWGWNEVYPPLMQVLSVYFIVRAARRRSWGDWAMAGFLLGLGMYTYLSIRLAVLAIGAYLVYRAIVERGFLRRNWQGLAVFAAV